MDDKELRTTDIYLASSLVASGMRLNRIEDESFRDRLKAVFIVEEAETMPIGITLSDYVNGYWAKNLQVDAFTVFEAMNAIKKRIFSDPRFRGQY